MQYDPRLDMLVDSPIAGATPGIARAQVAAPTSYNAPNFDEIRKKKLIAERLRGRTGKAYTPEDSLYTVKGNNTVPDYQGINYAGMFKNAVAPWMEIVQEDRAADAEAEASAARSAALEQILGSGDKMSMRDAIMAKESLGVDVSGMVKDPREEKLGALRMIAQNPATAGSFLAMGVLTQDEIDAYMEQDTKLKDQERTREREDFLWKEKNTYRAPVAGQKITAEEAKYNLWAAANPGKNYNDYLAATGGGKTTAAGAGKAAETAEIGANLAQSASDLRALIESDTGGELFGGLQGASTGLSNIGEKGAGTVIGELASYAGGKLENPMTTQLRALNLDAVLEQARKLAPVTDTDFSKLMLSKPNAFKTKESALAFVEHLERVAKRYNIPMGGAGAATGLQWSPDLGMTEAQWNSQTPEWQKRFMEAQ